MAREDRCSEATGIQFNFAKKSLLQFVAQYPHFLGSPEAVAILSEMADELYCSAFYYSYGNGGIYAEPDTINPWRMRRNCSATWERSCEDDFIDEQGLIERISCLFVLFFGTILRGDNFQGVWYSVEGPLKPIDVSLIDIKELPSVSVENLCKLPESPGVYFVKDANGPLFYIGKSVSLRSRWQSHEKKEIFDRAQSQGARVAIHYLETFDQDRIENEAIQRFKPMLNWQVKKGKGFGARSRQSAFL